MAKLMLILSILYVLGETLGQPITFDSTNIIWTIFNGRKQVAAFLPGDPFRGPRRYGTIPWKYSAKIPYGISYHYARNTLVFSDLNRQSIYFIDTASGFWNVTKFHAGFGWVEHTAMDWVSDNLYWVDGYYEWVAMKSLDSTDVHEYKIIADVNVVSPRGIVVDPNMGYVYWTDISDPPRIVRSELDGSRQVVLAAQGLINPFDITLKPDNGQIFWVDRSRDTVETVMYDGTGRNVIFTSHQGQPVGLSYYKDHLFLADTTFDDVVVLDMVNGLGKTFFKLNQRTLGIARVLTVWAEENQPDKHNKRGACSRNGCDQDCVLTPNRSPKCLCRENYMLQNDGRACKQITKIPHHALVLTNGTDICAYHLTAPQGGDVPDTLECFKEGRSDDDIRSLAIDSRNMKIYYTSKQRSEIRSMNMDGSGANTVVSGVKSVGGLTFDYVKNELYWTDTIANQIKRITQSGAVENVHLDTNLGDLTIDPYHRHLFYIKAGSANAIAMYDLDEKKKTPLTNAHADKPQRITYDDKKKKVYWTDLGKIQAVTYEGNVEPAVGTLNVNNRAIVSYGKFLMWSTAQSNGTSLIHMYKPPDKTTYKRLQVSFPGQITDFAIFDKLRHAPDRDGCFVKNGGCQHVCIPGVRDSKCVCNLGYTLNKDGKTCNSNLVSDNFTFASDPMSRRVVQVNLNNGNIAGTAIGEGTMVSNVVVVGQTAYWADQNRRVIKKSSLDGSGAKSLHNAAKFVIQRIAVDPATENIFYTATDGNKGVVGVVNMEGTRYRTLFDNVKYVRDIKIHSGLGLIFWVERKDNPGIERATMHGQNRMLIYNAASNSLIFGIEIDYEGNQLYWCNKRDGLISRSDFFGGDIVEVLRDKQASVTDIAIFGQYLFYTGTNSNGIMRVDKKYGTNPYRLAETHLFSQLHDLYVFSTTFPAPSNAKCKERNAGCSSFCLPTNDTRVYVCECSNWDTLSEDLKTCAGDKHPDLLPKPPGGSGTTTVNPFIPTKPITTKPIPSSSGTTNNINVSTNDRLASSKEDSGPNAAAIAVPIVLVVVIAVGVIAAVLLYRRRQSKRSPLVSEPRGSENPSYFKRFLKYRDGENLEPKKRRKASKAFQCETRRIMQ
ncbi:low-density lipoprotein receptor-related protein 4-like [Liolophura sinensis]|uniref:low-density lipoprotein receptor-related protein 4-like n=1 Tax=Liolophura sinensis TaxID=3198878 RepID=UPI00315803A7